MFLHLLGIKALPLNPYSIAIDTEISWLYALKKALIISFYFVSIV
jgi:hypothetical protein